MPSDSRAPPVAVGEVLAGKYRVERVIGEGGMGIVVAATHLQLDTLVALKFILQDKGQAVARFIREARSAVRLKSEHVARVSDVGTLENGMPYMVMEYLEGRDLHSLLEAGGPLAVSDAVGYVVHACEAIAEAHALGIVHRDLKPHNLFLTSGVGGRPKVKVLDFGISKTTGAELALTRSTEIVGTPSYMAPEQLRSAKDVDLRADIWAIGAVLYELLTGRLPFEAETLPQLCTMVLSETPLPPSTHRPDIPQALSDVILRCLKRAPADRFADVGDLVTALAPFSSDWAPASAVLEVPRSSTSGPARAVITSPSGPSARTDAAWSETELAGSPRLRWKTPLIVLVAVLAGAGLLVMAWRMGATDARRSGVPAASSGPVATAAPVGPGSAAGPAVSSEVAPPPPATAPSGSASASTVTSAAPMVSNVPPAHSSGPPRKNVHAKPQPQPAPGDSASSEEYERSHR
jgi:eukaryotic-like serine/threonine-protein kinase